MCHTVHYIILSENVGQKLNEFTFYIIEKHVLNGHASGKFFSKKTNNEQPIIMDDGLRNNARYFLAIKISKAAAKKLMAQRDYHVILCTVGKLMDLKVTPTSFFNCGDGR